MMSISVNIPEGVLFDTKMTQSLAEAYARKAVALSYYTKNGVSLGYCAEIAGMTKTDFIKYFIFFFIQKIVLSYFNLIAFYLCS